MGLTRIRDIRNEELIDATIAAIHLHGFINVTVARIADQAHASPATVLYYFGSKERLLEATMISLLNILKAATLERLATTNSPTDRLLAVLYANFDDRLYTKEHCNVWTQFWANAPYETGLARLHIINRSRVTSNLRAALRQLMPVDKCETARRTLQNYMDGDWVRAAQSQQACDAADARIKMTNVAMLILNAAQ